MAHLIGAGQGNPRRDVAGGRIEDIAEAAAFALDLGAADVVVQRLAHRFSFHKYLAFAGRVQLLPMTSRRVSEIVSTSFSPATKGGATRPESPVNLI